MDKFVCLTKVFNENIYYYQEKWILCENCIRGFRHSGKVHEHLLTLGETRYEYRFFAAKCYIGKNKQSIAPYVSYNYIKRH